MELIIDGGVHQANWFLTLELPAVEIIEHPRDFLSIVVPCLNEEKNISTLVSRTLHAIATAKLSGELIIISDGSTDNTINIVHRLQHKYTHHLLRLIVHKSNRGIEQSWKSGLGLAKGNLVCLMDGDLQNRPEDIIQLYKSFFTTPSTDIVQGVRCPVLDLTLKRPFLFSLGLNYILNLAFKMTARDNKSGFLLTRKTTLVSILTHKYKYKYFQCFIRVSAQYKGYTLKEIHTVFEQRQSGFSFLPSIPLFAILSILIEIIKYKVELSNFKPR